MGFYVLKVTARGCCATKDSTSVSPIGKIFTELRELSGGLSDGAIGKAPAPWSGARAREVVALISAAEGTS